ncbi:MAG: 50S ribosomal protein L23 [Flavobacteriales bacterium]|jgi:large subunit ribosomal protein L23
MGVIIKPIITEKYTAFAEKFNRFGFIVEETANKVQIKQAVEQAYGVKVKEVNTIRHAGKVKTRNTKQGFNMGITGRCKKAIVTLAAGDTIDFYSNI